jgi:hypothetical protein
LANIGRNRIELPVFRAAFIPEEGAALRIGDRSFPAAAFLSDNR